VTYIEFLKQKMEIAPDTGILDISADEVNPILKPHERDTVLWMVRGGRRANFSAFGLGKTLEQLEACRLIIKHAGGKALITLPLGVKQEFTRDAVELLGMPAPQYVRNMAEVGAADGDILLTNYERVRDGDIDPKYFTVCSLDEASVLRSYGSKTYQVFLDKYKGVQFKFVNTATPAPNRYKEMIHYAGFLEIMDTGQALTRFFQRDSSKAGNLTIYPHKEKEFYIWLSSWALFVTKPSDLGYSDEGYALPPLEVRYHKLHIAPAAPIIERDGQMAIMRDPTVSLADAMAIKKESIRERVAKAAEIVAAAPEEHFILWHDLEDERREIERTFPSKDFIHWHEYKDGNQKALEMYERHYSCYKYADGRERKLFCGPGEKMVLMTANQDALFVWRKFKDDSGQEGLNCAVFRNEGDILSSELIIEAERVAYTRWPGERMYTYVNPEKIRSVNPGCCFKKAGWKQCGITKGGILIFEKQMEPWFIAPRNGLQSIYGSQDLDLREKRVIDFSEGRTRLFATKKELSGSGCNFQRYCHRAIFVGIDYEFNDFIQAIHRIYRFLQTERVKIDIIYTDSEEPILRVLLEKWKQYDELTAKMTEIIQKYGLSSTSIMEKLARTMGVDRVEVRGKNFIAVNNDCVLDLEKMERDSIGAIMTSIPFGNHYEYSASYNDFGYNENDQVFFDQLDFLTPQLLRVLMPGRIAGIHVKDRVLFGNVTGDGFPTVEPFSDMTVAHFMKHGFRYIGRIPILTDVVRENNQTYRLGWSEQCKDGSKMGVGCPEYLLLFRKLPSDTSNGYADVPVVKSKHEYTRAQWQIDAHAFWRSSGDRPVSKEELLSVPVPKLQAAYRKYSREIVYSYEEHVELAKTLDEKNKLPASFMVVAPGSWSDTVWDDINRMKTLNTSQSQRRLQMHVCPLQIDIVDRFINRFTNVGDEILDPFAGLFTVPVRAMKLGRRGRGIELNADYFRDGVGYCKAADEDQDMPTLFDFVEGL
jgi:DNA modification methylase